MRARGEARTPGRVVSPDIQHKADDWFLSLVVECEPHRERLGDAVVGLDWGVETMATLRTRPAQFAEIGNDRLPAKAQDGLKDAQRDLSRHLLGKRSKRATRARTLLARRSRKLTSRR